MPHRIRGEGIGIRVASRPAAPVQRVSGWFGAGLSLRRFRSLEEPSVAVRISLKLACGWGPLRSHFHTESSSGSAISSAWPSRMKLRISADVEGWRSLI